MKGAHLTPCGGQREAPLLPRSASAQSSGVRGTRRELLGLLLGSGIAAVGCKRAPPPPVAGTIRGGAMLAGHLALGERATPFSDRAPRVRVVIVGSGMAGLCAAWRLERSGLRDFVMLELEDEPGGTSRFGQDGVVPYPWAAHYVPAPDRENATLVSLLDEMGMVAAKGEDGAPQYAEQHHVWAPEERIFYRGYWYEGLYLHAGASEQDLADRARFFAEVERWVAFRDSQNRRAFTLPMRLGSRAPEVAELDRISMAQWLDERGLRSPRLRHYLDYACRDDYGLHLEDTSAWAGLFYFCSRVRTVEEGPAPLLTWPEGNGRFVSHLAKLVGSRLRTRTIVTRLSQGDDGVRVWALDRITGQRVEWLAESVIFALPQFLAPHIIDGWKAHRTVEGVGFQYGAWFVANLHLRDRPASRGAPLSWDNVLCESPSLGYVVATHQVGRDRGPTILTYYFAMADADPRAGRKRLMALDHAGFCDVILTDLERAHPGLRHLVERVDVYRWGHAMVQPRTGFVFGRVREAAAVPFGRIHFAHSDLSGLALLEEAVDRGVSAADAVLA